MAPNLGAAAKELADMMITDGKLTAPQMAEVINCHERTITRHDLKLGTREPPPHFTCTLGHNVGGR
ncbi:hypothetical protein ASPBRDRAFT_49536 [Aspergillus brasiliensis CBS 101740]|uniref:Uncharacterized protein n=1 Tax=Aspergillus brasiliensis (strain CBS 101740 / IMI 381727 / IBT 21946) TaxID=767769 RepID=A0A1L9U235_ASPBC|nr:hypothetical protein ASPBRDRAFT_49536 [Aspergillus brasiliensis CBS 101740]